MHCASWVSVFAPWGTCPDMVLGTYKRNNAETKQVRRIDSSDVGDRRCRDGYRDALHVRSWRVDSLGCSSGHGAGHLQREQLRNGAKHILKPLILDMGWPTDGLW